jgi:hypothetical protein
MTSKPNVRHRSRPVPVPDAPARQGPAAKKAARDRAAPDYEVGYGRPPKRGQFKPGKSGNSKGRPKGSKNLQDMIDAELNKTVVVNENGKRQSASKREVVAKRLINKALEGQDRAINTILGIDQNLAAAIKTESEATMGTIGGEPMNKTRRDILANYTDRLKATMESGGRASNAPAKPLDDDEETEE